MAKISELSDGGSILSADNLLALRTGGNVRVQVGNIAAQDTSAVAITGGNITGLNSLGVTGNISLPVASKYILDSNASSDSYLWASANDTVELWAGAKALTAIGANVTGHGNLDVSGNLDVTGEVSTDGKFVSLGNVAALPTGTGWGVYGSQTTGGATIFGKGSGNDVQLLNGSGLIALSVPTGTTNVVANGNLDVSGALEGGFIGASNNMRVDGHLTINGAATVPTSGQGKYAAQPADGAQILGYGSTNDVVLGNRTGAVALRVPANTQNVVANGNMTISGETYSNKLNVSHSSVDNTWSNAGIIITSYAAGSVPSLGFHQSNYAAANALSYNSGFLNWDNNMSVAGALSKGSGSFRIDHPLKPETHQLVHSFTESPQADLLYSGVSNLVDGAAEINLDEFHGMTEGTFVALNRNIRVFTTNESDWEPIRGSVTGNILSISCQDASCSDKVSWLVIGERHDKHMMDTEWTDEQGRVIVEPLKPEEPAKVQRTHRVPVMLDGEQVTALETVDVPESIEVIDGVAVLTPATTEEVLKPQFEDIGVVDVDGNPVYA